MPVPQPGLSAMTSTMSLSVIPRVSTAISSRLSSPAVEVHRVMKRVLVAQCGDDFIPPVFALGNDSPFQRDLFHRSLLSSNTSTIPGIAVVFI